MAIFTRPDGEIFAENAKQGEVVTFPDLKRGWGVTLDTTNGIPPMEFFNFTGNRADKAINYLLQNGVAPYSDDTEYPKDAVVRSGGILYIAKKQTKGVAPGGESETWNYLIPPASLSRAGVAQLSSSTTSTNETQAATPKAVKAAVDLAQSAKDDAKKANDNANGKVPITGKGVATVYATSGTTGDANPSVLGGSWLNGEVLTNWYIGSNGAGSSDLLIKQYKGDTNFLLKDTVIEANKTLSTAVDLVVKGGDVHIVDETTKRPRVTLSPLGIAGAGSLELAFNSYANGTLEIRDLNPTGVRLALTKTEMRLFGEKVLTESSFAGGLTKNGWCRLPNGLLLQWLSWKAPDQNSSVKRSWPMAFKEIFSVTSSGNYLNTYNDVTDIFYTTTQVWGRYQVECRVFAVGI